MTNGIHDESWASGSMWKNTTDDGKFSDRYNIQIINQINLQNVQSVAKYIISG